VRIPSGDLAPARKHRRYGRRRNPLPIVLPCHRVVGANGSMSGYAGGVERKQLLLELEQDALF